MKDPRIPLVAAGVLVALFTIHSSCEGPSTLKSSTPHQKNTPFLESGKERPDRLTWSHPIV